MEQESDSKKSLVTTLAVLVVIVIIVGGVVALTGGRSDTSNFQEPANTSPTSTSTPQNGSTDQEQPTSTQEKGLYKDGTYSATGTYSSPGGREAITVNITLADGKVSETSATSKPSDSTARDFQNEFIKAYKSLVVGKDVDSIRLGQVSGSSLTSQGFNAALTQIKSQAQSDS